MLFMPSIREIVDKVDKNWTNIGHVNVGRELDKLDKSWTNIGQELDK